MTADLDKEQVSTKENPTDAAQLNPELAEALRTYQPGTTEERKLVRKIDFFLMPMLWIMYILNYVDRTNIVSCAAMKLLSFILLIFFSCRATPRSLAWVPISL